MQQHGAFIDIMWSELPDTKEYIFYNSIYIKFENWQNFSMVLASMRMVISGERIMCN